MCYAQGICPVDDCPCVSHSGYCVPPDIVSRHLQYGTSPETSVGNCVGACVRPSPSGSGPFALPSVLHEDRTIRSLMFGHSQSPFNHMMPVASGDGLYWLRLLPTGDSQPILLIRSVFRVSVSLRYSSPAGSDISPSLTCAVRHTIIWYYGRDSNPRCHAWQACAIGLYATVVW